MYQMSVCLKFSVFKKQTATYSSEIWGQNKNYCSSCVHLRLANKAGTPDMIHTLNFSVSVSHVKFFIQK